MKLQSLSTNTSNKLKLYDELNNLVMSKLNWHWDDEQDGLVNDKSEYINWDESDSLTIPAVQFDGHTHSQVNVWGDGTIEFQNEEGESSNWNDFPEEMISNIIAALK